MFDWQPTAPLSNLKLKAQILKKIRRFFEEREVMEVETPLLCHSSVTDPMLKSFETTLSFSHAAQGEKLFLQTSPEYAMKRLLAANSGSIYQICKAFRNGEVGKKHNPEFTILEWYRVGFTHFDLMDEINLLLQEILQTKNAERISYLELFDKYFSINPHTCSIEQLKTLALKNNIIFESHSSEKDVWLDLLLTHIIEPELGMQHPIFVYDYPGSQAALAKIRFEQGYPVGERFEVYYKGMELANGYHELGDADEQLARFEEDNRVRNQLNLPIIPIDHYLLSALPFFPDCAGVALGLDRLACLASTSEQISEVIPFPIGRA